MAPPAIRVYGLMQDLLTWLKETKDHPLISSSVFHYEFEFIHPFSDGNGRLGRLWQTLILSNWKSIFRYIPIETIIHDRQKAYYRYLAQSDRVGRSTAFVEFMLESINNAMGQALETEQVTEQVRSLVLCLKIASRSTRELMQALKLSHRPAFLYDYLRPALEQGFIEMTQPDSPKSPTQKYRLSEQGKMLLSRISIGTQ